ncbi:MAG: hypothetical protein GWO38_26360 [Phycisphaerae bacterium]|nr:hypothetical protein [Phycisphaerae bacterium]NIX02576.1 hypothetical protein [Phycisphaerae bacterium]NIX31055.1 hypothetical protein [Phycisphaerae bacterium]
MAFYLVKAHIKKERMVELRQRLQNREFVSIRPFGNALTESLESARIDPDNEEILWEEEDYCSPPLAMERDAVLDHYFRDIRVEPVAQGEGWERIQKLPPLWEAL